LVGILIFSFYTVKFTFLFRFDYELGIIIDEIGVVLLLVLLSADLLYYL